MKLRTLIFIGLLSGPAAAQDVGQMEMTGTISAQIEAFQADDFATAFGFASVAIRQIFGSVDRFETMVRNGFPMVHHPSDVRFLSAREIDGRLWQKVMITDQEGALHMLDYNMVKDETGAWRINAVQILKAPAAGA